MTAVVAAAELTGPPLGEGSHDQVGIWSSAVDRHPRITEMGGASPTGGPIRACRWRTIGVRSDEHLEGFCHPILYPMVGEVL